jgi:hypothetical protein
MSIKVRRAALFAAAVVAVAGCAQAAWAAPISAPAWHTVKRVSSGPNGVFTAVTAAGQRGGWAFDGFTKATAWERNGSSWTQVPFPSLSNEMVVAAGASSATNVWAVTDEFGKSRALRWNGQHWTVMRSFSRAIGSVVVLSSADVWVFGQPDVPGADLGAWHYNGRAWTQVASGHGLEGGSGRSGSDIWAFDGADVAHWNGSTWSRTSLASLLPAKQELNGPVLTGIYEQSRHSVYAIGTASCRTRAVRWSSCTGTARCGPRWPGATSGSARSSSSVPDGHGGLWLPMPGFGGQKSYLLHYSDGHLTQAVLPGGPSKITVDTVALIPGTSDVLAGGDTHASADPGTDVVGVILQYEI